MRSADHPCLLLLPFKMTDASPERRRCNGVFHSVLLPTWALLVAASEVHFRNTHSPRIPFAPIIDSSVEPHQPAGHLQTYRATPCLTLPDNVQSELTRRCRPALYRRRSGSGLPLSTLITRDGRRRRYGEREAWTSIWMAPHAHPFLLHVDHWGVWIRAIENLPNTRTNSLTHSPSDYRHFL